MELFNLNKKKADFIKIKVEKLVDWNEPNGDGCVVSDKITKEGFKVVAFFAPTSFRLRTTTSGG